MSASAQPPTFLVPPEARAEWRRLSDALLDVEVACSRDPERWWSQHRVDQVYARRACACCPVKGPCGTYADIANERGGIWSGVDRGELSPRGYR